MTPGRTRLEALVTAYDAWLTHGGTGRAVTLTTHEATIAHDLDGLTRVREFAEVQEEPTRTVQITPHLTPSAPPNRGAFGFGRAPAVTAGELAWTDMPVPLLTHLTPTPIPDTVGNTRHVSAGPTRTSDAPLAAPAWT